VVQAFESLHGAELNTCAQPVVGLQSGEVQTLLSSGHTVGAPPVQTPARHASPVVHNELSLHGVPASALKNTHPDDGLHPSMVQAFPSLHTRCAPPRQAPAEQTSLSVHALPSLQLAVLSTH